MYCYLPLSVPVLSRLEGISICNEAKAVYISVIKINVLLFTLVRVFLVTVIYLYPFSLVLLFTFVFVDESFSITSQVTTLTINSRQL